MCKIMHILFKSDFWTFIKDRAKNRDLFSFMCEKWLRENWSYNSKISIKLLLSCVVRILVMYNYSSYDEEVCCAGYFLVDGYCKGILRLYWRIEFGVIAD